MATAQTKSKSEIREKVVQETITVRDGVTLFLSEEEAAFLTAIVYTRVTGGGKTRGLNDSICDALTKSGFYPRDNALTRGFVAQMTGYIHIERD